MFQLKSAFTGNILVFGGKLKVVAYRKWSLTRDSRTRKYYTLRIHMSFAKKKKKTGIIVIKKGCTVFILQSNITCLANFERKFIVACTSAEYRPFFIFGFYAQKQQKFQRAKCEGYTFMLQMNPGGILRILSDGDDRIGAKIKTQKTPWRKNYPPKNLMPNFRALKFSRRQ